MNGVLPSDRTIKQLFERELNRHRHSALAVRPTHSIASAEIALTGYSATVGSSRENASKNRYRDIIAYDRTRVLRSLKQRTSNAESDPADPSNYVNASLVVEPDVGVAGSPRRSFIAAQAPIESTIHAFLSLLLSCPSSHAHPASTGALQPPNLIVQVTPLVENRKSKCERYFGKIGERWNVPSENESLGIWVERMTDVQLEGWRLSKLQMGYEGDEVGKGVYHSEYQNWGDHGIPERPLHLTDFIARMNTINQTLAIQAPFAATPPLRSSSIDPPPILVHCSAGVGRTGTYIALSFLLPLHSLPHTFPRRALSPEQSFDPSSKDGSRLESLMCENDEGEIYEDFIALTVDGLREQRTTMVQTEEQLRFIYTAFEAGRNRAASR